MCKALIDINGINLLYSLQTMQGTYYRLMSDRRLRCMYYASMLKPINASIA